MCYVYMQIKVQCICHLYSRVIIINKYYQEDLQRKLFDKNLCYFVIRTQGALFWIIWHALFRCFLLISGKMVTNLWKANPKT